MKMEILGTGCKKCKRMMKNAEEAVANKGADAVLVKIEDVDEIVAKGVMMTPALIIDGEIKAMGRVPSVKEIEGML